MTSRLTISIDTDVKKRLHLLAKNRKRSVSGLIKELIMGESKKTKIKILKEGLGTHLSKLTLTEIPSYKNDKDLLRRLKEEKLLCK